MASATRATLEFGRDVQWAFDAPIDFTRIIPTGTRPLDDPAAATAAALADPFEFPALKHALIPGDRIAITLSPQLPCRDEVLAGLLITLSEGKISPEDVTICYAPGETISDHPADSLLGRTRHHLHEPGNRKTLSYLAASENANPIYFPRVICDADVVIPIGCCRPSAGPEAFSFRGDLFPTFTDLETRQRFNSRISKQAHNLSTRPSPNKHETEAAWLLGVQFAIQVIPGRGQTVLQVLAGDREGIANECDRLTSAVWTSQINSPCELVIASISARNRITTWFEVAEALQRLQIPMDSSGAIVLATDLSMTPTGPLTNDPRDSSSYSSEAGSTATATEVNLDLDGEAACANMLTEFARESRIYLISELDDSVVEAAGMIPLNSQAQLQRLASQFRTGLIVEEADQMVVHVRADSSDAAERS